ncbi:MAG: hypothetical protein IPO25_23030 [Saprospiraceae bacterium]|nr:hypothetical protein [Saprospiraceae bacterium]
MRRVTIQYGDKIILQDMDWVICSAESDGYCGSQWAGKSTLLSLFVGDNLRLTLMISALFGQPRGVTDYRGPKRLVTSRLELCIFLIRESTCCF